MWIAIIGLLLLVNILSPFILGLLSLLVNTWTRGRTEYRWGSRWFRTKAKLFVDPDYPSDREAYLFYETVCSVALFCVLGYSIEEQTFVIPITIGSIIAIIFVPRFVCDIAHSIRYNFKTRDADRIKELEQRLDQLEK